MSDTPLSSDPTPTPAPTVTDQPEASAAAPVDAAEAARLKREARKARILSKGSDRLARITNTGRGEGASAYLKDNTPSLPSTPTPNSSAQLNNIPVAAARDDDDPLEVDISTLSPRAGPPRGEDATNPFAMFGGGDDPMMMGGGAAGQGGQQNPMEALMAMMGGAGGGMGGPPGADGQPDMSGLPPQLAAMMQQFGAAGGPGGPGGASAVPTATTTKTLSERCFDLLQAILVVALAVVAAKSSLFDANRSSVLPDSVGETLDKLPPSSSFPSTLRRWAKLGYQQPSPLEWSSPLTLTTTTPFGLPLFWIFLSLELTLQAARIVVFSRKTPAPPSLLSTLTAMLPIPNLHLAVRLVSKYLALVNALVNDVSLLVFVFGLSVLWSGWKLGGVGMLEDAVKVGGFGHDEL